MITSFSDSNIKQALTKEKYDLNIVCQQHTKPQSRLSKNVTKMKLALVSLELTNIINQDKKFCYAYIQAIKAKKKKKHF